MSDVTTHSVVTPYRPQQRFCVPIDTFVVCPQGHVAIIKAGTFILAPDVTWPELPDPVQVNLNTMAADSDAASTHHDHNATLP